MFNIANIINKYIEIKNYNINKCIIYMNSLDNYMSIGRYNQFYGEKTNIHNKGREQLSNISKEFSYNVPMLGKRKNKNDSYKLQQSIIKTGNQRIIEHHLKICEQMALSKQCKEQEIDLFRWPSSLSDNQNKDLEEGKRIERVFTHIGFLLDKNKKIYEDYSSYIHWHGEEYEPEEGKSVVNSVAVAISHGLSKSIKAHCLTERICYQENGITQQGMLCGIFYGDLDENETLVTKSKDDKKEIGQPFHHLFENHLNANLENHRNELDTGIFYAFQEMHKKANQAYQGSRKNEKAISFVFLTQNEVWVSNEGDSRVLLIKADGETTRASATPVDSCNLSLPFMTRYSIDQFENGYVVLTTRALSCFSSNQLGKAIVERANSCSLKEQTAAILAGAIDVEVRNGKGGEQSIAVILAKIPSYDSLDINEYESSFESDENKEKLFRLEELICDQQGVGTIELTSEEKENFLERGLPQRAREAIITIPLWNKWRKVIIAKYYGGRDYARNVYDSMIYYRLRGTVPTGKDYAINQTIYGRQKCEKKQKVDQPICDYIFEKGFIGEDFSHLEDNQWENVLLNNYVPVVLGKALHFSPILFILNTLFYQAISIDSFNKIKKDLIGKELFCDAQVLKNKWVPLLNESGIRDDLNRIVVGLDLFKRFDKE